MTPDILEFLEVTGQIFLVGAVIGFAFSVHLLGALSIVLKQERTDKIKQVARRIVVAIVTRTACWGVNAVAASVIAVGWKVTDLINCSIFFSDASGPTTAIRVKPPPECVNSAASIVGDPRGYAVAAVGLVILTLSVSVGHWRLRGRARALFNTGEVAS